MARAHEDMALRHPGAYFFLRRSNDGFREPVGLIFACPCGCQRKGIAYFQGHQALDQQGYRVVGHWPLASLDPKIGIKEASTTVVKAGEPDPEAQWHWQGYLRDGEFIE